MPKKKWFSRSVVIFVIHNHIQRLFAEGASHHEERDEGSKDRGEDDGLVVRGHGAVPRSATQRGVERHGGIRGRVLRGDRRRRGRVDPHEGHQQQPRRSSGRRRRRRGSWSGGGGRSAGGRSGGSSPNDAAAADVAEDDAEREAVAERGDVAAPQIDDERDDVAGDEDGIGRGPVVAVHAADAGGVEAGDRGAVEHLRVVGKAVERQQRRRRRRRARRLAAIGVGGRGCRFPNRHDVDGDGVGSEGAESDEDLLMREGTEGRGRG